MPMENNLTLKTYMAIMAERDAAIRERNMALDERKRLFAERDMAMLQRDAALAERNSAIEERDKALAALHLREDSINENNNTNNNNLSHDESKHIYQQMHDVPWLAEPAYHPTLDDPIHVISDHNTAKPKKGKQKKETASSSRKLPKPIAGKVVKREAEIQISNDWTNELNFGSDEDDDEDEEAPALWRENSGLNQITFDETVMPAPVCGCSGVAHPCYKWGNGGWQSACCSSGYALSGGKRQTGRKMSGSAFTQLLNQIASEGYDLSTPVDLTNYWEN
ncbi:protein BASIC PENTACYSTEINE6-like [Impatiens glandulifera]|uniref:protein BASIC PENTACYSTEINE6-like n=1 Tax=Impatiens glandulifera TaxID=253017 RepID=UPI001FB12042|nr:protein BASIC PENTACYSTEINE6-like [Impatiens glandulifera]